MPGCSQTAPKGTIIAGIGLALIVTSSFQLVVPGRIFAPPQERVLGLPLVPVSVLGLSATLLTLGVILAGEGICIGLGAPSLWSLVVADPLLLLYILGAGAVSGVVMEIVAQWLGKLWVYPYWTAWFYAFLLIPGFAFYWLSIAESYLAVKAVLDTLATRRRGPRGSRFAVTSGIAGAVALLASLFLFLHWYAHQGGLTLAITTATATAPSFVYALLALAGLTLAAQWVLHRQRRPSPLAAAEAGYWVPLASVACASLILAAVMETQNAVHHHWMYTHFPAAEVALDGVPLSVYAAWPLQYLVFLLIPSLIRPELATIFWRSPTVMSRRASG